ncbi:HPr family phosphocarrier protein [Escherichia coli]|nr:HPr family phosphocarrier protein [Escherichia coli]EFM9732439.1 HPr family phosphocarrier protein [Escherichia coli]EGF3466997.1 HPr family phosphocarrier protein [Escherichia coli]
MKNEHGIHARPGAYMVNILKPFNCAVKIANLSRNDHYVNAKSLMALMSLGIKNEHEVSVIFDGEDAQRALQQLSTEIENGLGE